MRPVGSCFRAASSAIWWQPIISRASELRALAVEDLFDIVARHGLHFDQSRQTGVVFHMISSLTEHGRIGVTAVGQSPEEAMHIYEEAKRVLLAEGGRSPGGK